MKTSELAPGAVIPQNLSTNSVLARAIASVTSGDLAPGAVTSDDLAPAAVNETAIAPLAISAGKLKDDAVGTRSLEDDAVTTDIVAPGAIRPASLSQFPSVRLTTSADVPVPTNTLLNEGDFFEVWAAQGSGETLALDRDPGTSPVVSAEWVAPPQ